MSVSEEYERLAKVASRHVELIVLFNGKGDVIEAICTEGHGAPRIAENEGKNIFGDGVLASDNWCRWVKLADGTWV